ncbi:pseudaminic acid synthase [Clostridiaceae bacterium 35-E11]
MPTYIIAEMSANHAGELDRALEIVHAAKESGADCVKIQTYTADTLTIDSNKRYFQINKGTWTGENLYRLYEKAYTPWDWQGRIKEEAEKIGLDFLSTPFDYTAVDFLEDLGVEFYKIASFELVDIPLIKYIASKGKPIIMSTGIGTLGEIEYAVNVIKNADNQNLCILKCSSAYPAIPEDMNLRTIQNLKDIFKVPVGLSDHSMGSIGAVTAVAVGANVIEKHFCISREIENPDSSFSMEPHEFKQMVKDIRSTEKALGTVSYEVSKKEEESRIFRKSIFVVKNILKGEVLTKENIRVIRPGYGLEPKYFEDVLGKVATKDIEEGEPLHWSMFM